MTDTVTAKPSVTLVTGAGSGLGLALALKLGDLGEQVVGVSRRPPSEARWEALRASGAAVHVSGDVSEPETVSMAFSAGDRLGTIGCVVNCAGQGVFGAVGSSSRSDVDTVFAANLIGTILFSEKAVEIFRNRGGTIVNVLSTAAQVPRANESIYCAAKWGARGYTESLRLEVKGLPIRVLSVYPGGMRTRFWQEAKGTKVDPAPFMTPEEVADIIVDAIKSRASRSYVSEVVINRR